MNTVTDEERFWNRARLAQTLTAIAALWAVVAALTVVGAWAEARRMGAAAAWPAVTGSVSRVEVVPVEVRGRAPVLRPGVQVTYDYVVEGETFTSDRVQVVARRVDPESELGRSLLALSPGDEVTVYVNPDAPGEAVLRPDVSWRGVVNGLVLLALAGVIGVLARRVAPRNGRAGPA